MFCPFCKTRQATLHFLEIIDQQKTEIHICEVCAAEKGYIKGGDFTIGNLISSMLQGATPTVEEPKLGKEKEKRKKNSPRVAEELACPFCEATWTDLRNSGRIGCTVCYETFEQPIGQLLENTQGSAKHLGKFPPHRGDQTFESELRRMQVELDKAVAKEQYEAAAKLRDQIRELRRTNDSLNQ